MALTLPSLKSKQRLPMNHQEKTVENKGEELETKVNDTTNPAGAVEDSSEDSVENSLEDSAEVEEENKEEVEEVNYQDKYLRLYAEFDNFRKRTMRERADLIMTASQDVLVKLLPLIDDFERADKNASDDAAAMKEGMKLIHAKLESTLTSKGLKVMDVKAGDDFNVDYHEAITNIPAPTPKLKGKIVDVVESGYMLGDKVLRYAKVVIGQ
jgi:molecular chaperone GrpE